MAEITIPAGNVKVVITITDAMTRAATGLAINQIDMLRAVFEDQFGIDPATLTMDEIMFTARSVINSPEQDPASGLQSQSGINRSLSEGTPREGANYSGVGK